MPYFQVITNCWPLVPITSWYFNYHPSCLSLSVQLTVCPLVSLLLMVTGGCSCPVKLLLYWADFALYCPLGMTVNLVNLDMTRVLGTPGWNVYELKWVHYSHGHEKGKVGRVPFWDENNIHYFNKMSGNLYLINGLYGPMYLFWSHSSEKG